MTKIVSLANQKGGVGKTTTAINLGASLGACERKVLIVDLDPQANATSGVGISKTLDLTMYDVLVDGVPMREIIQPTELPTVFLAPSSVDLVGAEVELRDSIGREYHLRRALESIAGDYDYVLVDSPPFLAVGDAAALASKVDGVIVIMKMGEITKTMLRDTAEFLEPLPCRKLGVVLTHLVTEGGPYSYHYYREYGAKRASAAVK